MADHATLVAQIKEMQKTIPGLKEVWWNYCAQFGGNTRDPASHPVDYLQNFLAHVETQGVGMGAAPVAGAGTDVHTNLVMQVKEIQRIPEGKAAWAMYCGQNAGGSRDPALHDIPFLMTFLQSMQMGMGAMVACGVAADPQHAYLANQVKMAQKTPEGKMAWAAYCAQYGGNSRDPNLHDATYLMGFLQSLGMQATGKRPHSSIEESPRKQELVEQIKANQRVSETFKLAWVAHCAINTSGSRDPQLHDEASLEAFLQQNPISEAEQAAAAMMPPAKRLRNPMGQPRPAGANLSHAHGLLVQQVSACLKRGPEWTEAWSNFCDSIGAISREPIQHTMDTLKEFLIQNNLTPVEAPPSATPTPARRPPMMPRMPMGMGMGMRMPRGMPMGMAMGMGRPPMAGGNGMAHMQLVAAVKAGQSQSPAFKQAWLAHCMQFSGTRDPNLHTMESLSQFMAMNSYML